MPGAADEARALAQEYRASGVVWIATEPGGASLWIYDASTDQVVTRRVDATPPFDAPTAAAAALSVKTLLRSSTVAPPAERLGAAPAPPPASPAPPRAPSDEARPVESGAPPRASEAALRAELEGAGRALADKVDLRVAIGASAWLGARRNMGVALVGSFGPGLSIDAPRFAGRFAEVALSPSARLRLPLGRGLILEPRVGTSLHATSIDGVAVRTTRAAATSRLDGSLDAALALDLAATRTIGVALDLGVSAMLRYQRYLVDTEAIFELRPFQAFAGLRLTTGLL
jgi:hypothetical protein